MQYDKSKKEVAPAEKEKMKPVVEGAKLQKQSAMKKASKAFLEEDIKTVSDSILHEYVLPGAKNLLYSVLTNALGMTLFGQNGNPAGNVFGQNKNYVNSNAGRVSYNNYSNYSQQPRQAFADSNYIGGSFNYDEIVYPNAGAAESVLDSMQDSLDRGYFVTVADLYDLSGITISNPQTTRYGWTNLNGAHVVRLLGGGCSLSLPRPKPID